MYSLKGCYILKSSDLIYFRSKKKLNRKLKLIFFMFILSPKDFIKINVHYIKFINYNDRSTIV